MSLLDTASLVITPNGYKEGKLYSVVPSDGSGDLNVTRATTATRVNEAGLVELVPYNLLDYSEQLDNAYWSKYQATITANNTSAPNGSLTADKITQTGTGSATFYITSFPLSGGIVTLSCYYKKGTNNKSVLELNRTTQSFSAEFNLDTEVITATGNYVSTNMEDVGNGWFRCSVVSNQTAGTVDYFAFGNIGSNGTTLYAWGVQLNEGTIKDYQKTETRLNIPRLDYSNGTCPSILVEPQRTNLNLYTEDLTNAWYNKFNSSISANAITAPTGLTTADKVVEDTSNSFHYIETTNSLVNSSTYTVSAFLKKGERTFGFIGVYTFETKQIRVNLTNGTIENTVGTWISTSIEDYGNDWYRVIGTFSAGSTTYFFTGSALNATTVSYTGDGTSGIYIWGTQLEAGSYATSYIPTTSASVTRNADVINKTSISSLIGQTSGTVFLDFVARGGDVAQEILGITLNGGGSEYIAFYSLTSGALYFITNLTGGGVLIDASSFGERFKVAYSFTSGSHVLYVNGVQIYTSTTASTYSLLNALYLGVGAGSTGQQLLNTNSSVLWKTRLTNTQLAQLTTI